MHDFLCIIDLRTRPSVIKTLFTLSEVTLWELTMFSQHLRFLCLLTSPVQLLCLVKYAGSMDKGIWQGKRLFPVLSQ
jgi:hypothetical protein